jgi:hypothetical protein
MHHSEHSVRTGDSRRVWGKVDYKGGKEEKVGSPGQTITRARHYRRAGIPTPWSCPEVALPQMQELCCSKLATQSCTLVQGYACKRVETRYRVCLLCLPINTFAVGLLDCKHTRSECSE